MILLAATTDKLQLARSSTANVDVHASFVDLNGTTVTPGRENATFSTAATGDIVSSPSSSTFRTVKTLSVRNRHASTSCDVTVIFDQNGTGYELIKCTITAGEALYYDEHQGFTVRDLLGQVKNFSTGISPATVNQLNTVVLGFDVVNNNGTANTIADVTGLSFSVNAGETYYFEFVIPYTAAATATGSRWSISGPGSPTLLNYRSEYTLTATTTTINSATAYDTPAGSNASSLTAGNVATIWGVITPSSSGTVIARFASEVASSAITAKAGALLRWYRVL